MNKFRVTLPFLLSRKYNISDKRKLEQYINDLLFSNYHNYDTLEGYVTGSKIEYFPPSELLTIVDQVMGKIDNRKVKPGKERTFYPNGQKRPLYTTLTEYGVCTVFNSEIAPYFTVE